MRVYLLQRQLQIAMHVGAVDSFCFANTTQWGPFGIMILVGPGLLKTFWSLRYLFGEHVAKACMGPEERIEIESRKI